MEEAGVILNDEDLDLATGGTAYFKFMEEIPK